MKEKSRYNIYDENHREQRREYARKYRESHRKYYIEKAKEQQKRNKHRPKSILKSKYKDMLRRTGLGRTPSKKDIKNYISRGITVCEEWRTFKNFYEWAISHGWNYGLQLDRINNDGNYCPENCRFVTSEINNLNRRNNIFIDVNGESVLAKEYFSNSNHDDSVDYNTFISRVKHGWEIERSLWTRKRNKNKTV